MQENRPTPVLRKKAGRNVTDRLRINGTIKNPRSFAAAAMLMVTPIAKVSYFSGM